MNRKNFISSGDFGLCQFKAQVDGTSPAVSIRNKFRDLDFNYFSTRATERSKHQIIIRNLNFFNPSGHLYLQLDKILRDLNVPRHPD